MMITLDWLLHQAKLARMKKEAERQEEAEQARKREEARVSAPQPDRVSAPIGFPWETEAAAAERLRTERRWPGVRVYDPIQQRERTVYPPFPVEPGLNEERFKEWWAKHLELEQKRQRQWSLPAAAYKASAEPLVPRAARERIGDVPYFGPQLRATTETLSSPLLLSLLLAPELAPVPAPAYNLILRSLEHLGWLVMTNPEKAIKAEREKRGQAQLTERSEVAKQFTEALRQEAEEQKKAKKRAKRKTS